MTTPSPSEQARPQHLEALHRANVVRVGIARLKKLVAAGDLLLDDVILGDVPDDLRLALERVELFDLLTSARRVGPGTARKLAAAAACPEAKRVGRLTDRQRQIIADGARVRAPWTCRGRVAA